MDSSFDPNFHTEPEPEKPSSLPSKAPSTAVPLKFREVVGSAAEPGHASEHEIHKQSQTDFTLTPPKSAEEQKQVTVTKPESFEAAFTRRDYAALGLIAAAGQFPKEMRDADGKSLLLQAIDSRDLDMANFLIEELKLVDLVNSPDKRGDLPLLCALDRGYRDFAALLLANGADVTLRDGAKRSALDCDCSDRLICMVLEKHPDLGALIAQNPNRKWLLSACSEGKDHLALTLLKHGIDITFSDHRGRTALHLTSSPEVAALLLEKGAKIDLQDADGSSPLLVQAEHGHAAVLARLIDAGAALESHNIWGQSALHMAKNRECIDLLTNAGLKPSLRDHVGRTPLHIACSNNNLEAAHALLEKWADEEAKDSFGCTPLDWLESLPRYQNVQELSRLLVACGAKPSGVKELALAYSTPLTVVPTLPVQGINDPKSAKNRENIEAFIQAHAPDCQAAVRAMLEATDYVSLQQFLDDFNTLIVDRINDRLKPDEKYLIVVAPQKSNKWLAELALHRLKVKPANVLTVDKLMGNLDGIDRIVFLDDASYSGEQMCNRFIRATQAALPEGSKVDITVGIPYMTPWAEEKLEATKTGGRGKVEILPHKMMRPAAQAVDPSHHDALVRHYFRKNVLQNLFLLTGQTEVAEPFNIFTESVKDALKSYKFSGLEKLDTFEKIMRKVTEDTESLEPPELFVKLCQETQALELANELVNDLLDFCFEHVDDMPAGPAADLLKGFVEQRVNYLNYDRGLDSRTLTVFDHKVADSLSTCPAYENGEVYENGVVKVQKGDSFFSRAVKHAIFPGKPPYKR